VTAEHNLGALARLQEEPGMLGAFTREQAPGAIANGARVVKSLMAPGDTHELGASATVLGSIGPQPEPVNVGDRIVPAGSFVYFVAWDDQPALAVSVSSDRIAPA
jgi:hypothetical protein